MTTENDILQIVEDVKAYLGITWDDEIKEHLYALYVKGSIARIERIYGYALDFCDCPEIPVNEDYPEDNHLARELLMNRVFYMNEHALDDFEANYRGELNTLRLHGAVRKNLEHAE